MQHIHYLTKMHLKSVSVFLHLLTPRHDLTVCYSLHWFPTYLLSMKCISHVSLSYDTDVWVPCYYTFPQSHEYDSLHRSTRRACVGKVCRFSLLRQFCGATSCPFSPLTPRTMDGMDKVSYLQYTFEHARQDQTRQYRTNNTIQYNII
jgi:hypothetical protein